MLSIRGLNLWHGPVQALRDLDFDLAPGQVLAVLGRNGSGRSSLARALMGLLPCVGQIRWQGQELRGRPPHQIARLGFSYVPETRDAFTWLTVRDNLRLGAQGADCAARIAWVCESFPQLHARMNHPAGVLSGGEQQMLSLARALMGRPRVLIVDEPTEGLAPHLVQRVGDILQQQAREGVALVLMEQKLNLTAQLAQQVLLLGRGRAVFSGSVQQWQGQDALRRQWLDL
ncbi:MAG: ABC transporter ATP-binding protein [Betaproteobacteria bacterium]|nr:ABC transporter ATP-binding protein [Betaproteobacteria bacterium]